MKNILKNIVQDLTSYETKYYTPSVIFAKLFPLQINKLKRRNYSTILKKTTETQTKYINDKTKRIC